MQGNPSEGLSAGFVLVGVPPGFTSVMLPPPRHGSRRMSQVRGSGDDSRLTWIPSNGWPPERNSLIAFAAGITAILWSWAWFTGGPGGIISGLLLRPHRGRWDDIPVVWGLLVGIPLASLLAICSQLERAVGIGDDGITVSTWLTRWRIPWNGVGFGPFDRQKIPSGNWSHVWYRNPGLLRALWTPQVYTVSREQMRAILGHPMAPVERFPQAVRLWARY
jgi:hypothetical protein